MHAKLKQLQRCYSYNSFGFSPSRPRPINTLLQEERNEKTENNSSNHINISKVGVLAGLWNLIPLTFLHTLTSEGNKVFEEPRAHGVPACWWWCLTTSSSLERLLSLLSNGRSKKRWWWHSHGDSYCYAYLVCHPSLLVVSCSLSTP